MAFVYWCHLAEHTDISTQGYIGFTSKTVKTRWRQHNDDSRRYPHIIFYKALAKYGDKITVTTLVEGSNEYCLELENKLRPRNKIGWNIKVGGDLGSIGVIPSEETRKRMSEMRKGDKNAFHGKTHSEEQKEKWAVSRCGKPFSSAAMSKSLETKKNNPWNIANTRKAVWAAADEIQLLLSRGISVKILAEKFSVTVHSIKTIVKKLSSGWIPANDPHWLTFTEQYNKE